MGTATFNCLEFADDIVSHAVSNGISAEIIGIKLKGKLIGHACAGFPTADGNMLYFDSTPSEGKKSHAAHQAFVELGEPYRRADGGELGGGVGRLPISEIIPVTPLPQTTAESTTPQSPAVLSPFTTLAIQTEDHVQARGILYADANSLQVSDRQLKKWQETVAERTAELKEQHAAHAQALTASAAKLAARALQENEQLAAEGDPYAQMRMGERYLKGEGVQKDPVKGRHYLELASNAGSSSALEELNRLND
jgi:TPR repeat protein